MAIIDIPQSISTVTKGLTYDKIKFTLKDVVDDEAGVNQYWGYDEYTIRGFRAENARDINGLRGYNSTYTSSTLVNIGRVEVIKGPTATTRPTKPTRPAPTITSANGRVHHVITRLIWDIDFREIQGLHYEM